MVEKRPRYALIPIFMAFLIDNFGLAIIYPILTPLFLLPEFSLLPESVTFFKKTTLYGLTIAAFPFAQLFGAPIIGESSDRIGRKKAFFISITGTSFGYVLTALGISLLNLPLIMAGRLISGFFAGNLSLCLASLADLTPDPNKRTRIFGRIGSFGGLFFTLGIVVGTFYVSPQASGLMNPSIPFWFVSFFGLVNLALILLFFHESAPKKIHGPFDFALGVHNIVHGLRDPLLRRIYFVYFFFMICWVSAMQFAVTFLIKEFSASSATIQAALLTAGIVWALTNGLMSKELKRKQGFLSLLSLFLLLLTCLLLMFSLTKESWQFIVLLGLSAFCGALCWSLTLASVSLRSSPEAQGRSLGINQSMGALAAMIGPLCSGLLAGANVHFVYVFAAAASFIAFSIIFYDLRQKRKLA